MTGVKGVVGLAIAAVAVLAAAAGVYAVIDRMAVDNRAAERRALLAREAELTARILAPGSPLACLDGGASETVGNACEKTVFADAATTSAALSFTAARLVLLQDVARLGEHDKGEIAAAFAMARRSIQLDRFGLAAQVLADRDGCTPERCAAFALVSEAGALKANMKARVFDQYVSRYAANWGGRPASPEPAPQVSAPAVPPPPDVASVEPAPATGHPVDPKWDFPSAASIPPVSIMNAEPPRPKVKEGAEAQAAQARGESVPVPQKRPQAQAPAATQAR